MTDLLERTHHEPLVPKRLHSALERPRPESRRWRTLLRGLGAIALAVVAAMFLWAGRADDEPEDDTPAPVVLPQE